MTQTKNFLIMTTEQKAKAYDKVLEKAKEIIRYYKEHNRGDEAAIEDLETIFPELKESEDERVRKEIIKLVKFYYGSSLALKHTVSKDEMLAWLEKQAQSITLTIPKYLKGTDPDGGVVGEKGKQPTDKNFRERYENIAKSDWFKKNHKDISVNEGNDVIKVVYTDEQAIISRLDKIIELLSWKPSPNIIPYPYTQPITYDTNKIYCDTASKEGGEE